MACITEQLLNDMFDCLNKVLTNGALKKLPVTYSELEANCLGIYRHQSVTSSTSQYYFWSIWSSTDGSSRIYLRAVNETLQASAALCDGVYDRVRYRWLGLCQGRVQTLLRGEVCPMINQYGR